MVDRLNGTVNPTRDWMSRKLPDGVTKCFDFHMQRAYVGTVEESEKRGFIPRVTLGTTLNQLTLDLL